MRLSNLTPRFAQSTRGRIAKLLRGTSRTVDAIAREIGLSHNAVRAHLVALERDGLVEAGPARRRSVGKPAATYSLTAEAERLFSRAYLPVLDALLSSIEERLGPAGLEQLMAAAGRGLAAGRPVPTGDTARDIVRAAAELEALGGAVTIERASGGFALVGASCPVGAVTGRHPEVCRAMAAFVSGVVGAPVEVRCVRDGRPRCRFEIPA